jgi:hypothetical protein
LHPSATPVLVMNGSKTDTRPEGCAVRLLDRAGRAAPGTRGPDPQVRADVLAPPVVESCRPIGQQQDVELTCSHHHAQAMRLRKWRASDAETDCRRRQDDWRAPRARALGEPARGSVQARRALRLQFAGVARDIIPGPFVRRTNVRSASAFFAREHSTTESMGTARPRSSDVRAWIFACERSLGYRITPQPAGLDTCRYMVAPQGVGVDKPRRLPASRREALSRLIEETTRAGVHLARETMRPSARGRRYLNTSNGISVFDGPFVESKELLGGYVIVKGLRSTRRTAWFRDYIAAVGPREVDVSNCWQLQISTSN